MELLLLPSSKDLHSNCFIFLHPNRYSVNQKFICFCLPACLHSLFAVCFLPARACLKNALRKMCVTICGRFCSDEGVVVDYDNRIRTKYTAKWGVQIAGMIFQTHSSVACRYAAKQWNPVSFYMNFVMIHYCSLKMSDSKIRERKNFRQKSCK